MRLTTPCPARFVTAPTSLCRTQIAALQTSLHLHIARPLRLRSLATPGLPLGELLLLGVPTMLFNVEPNRWHWKMLGIY